jgi:hypothetical protein
VPAASMPVAMSVRPGDTIDAQVTVDGHRATLALRDVTRGRSFAKTVSSAQIDVSSAEWIVEAPSDCSSSCLTLPLADFGTAAFTQAKAQPRVGNWGPVNDPRWSATQIRLHPPGGHLADYQGNARVVGAATPTVLARGGSAFSVAFSRVFVPSAPFSTRRTVLRAGQLVHPRAHR